MSRPESEPTRLMDCSIHAVMDRELLRQVDEVRQAIQSSLVSSLVVSRGDVVRLALRRLVLSYLAHLSESASPPTDLAERWQRIVDAARAEGTVPDWLVPGRSEIRPADPGSAGRKRKGGTT